MGAESAGVTVDLMSCKRCGADLPAVRGRKRYSLVGQEKLAAMVADLEEAKRVNSEMESLADTMAKRSQGVIVETEKARVKGELSVIQSRVSALETETQGLEARRDRLAKTVATIASRVAV
jgi:chaperonin cofactor prefoldin